MFKDTNFNVLQLASMLGLIFWIAGCTQKPITVKKEPITIEKQISGSKFSPSKSRPTDSISSDQANTEWFFHCYCAFSYEPVNQSDTGKSFHTDLIIKAVKITLTLPITMWLPAQASTKLVAHEEGHVKLCEDYYKYAEQLAENAAHKVIGKIYHGSASTKELAQDTALREAAEDICSQYRRQTVDIVNSISKLYDDLSAHGTNRLSPDEALNKATNKYYKEKQQRKTRL